MKELNITGNIYNIRELEKTDCITLVDSEKKRTSDGSEKWQNTWVDVYIDKANMSEYNVGDLIKVKGDFLLTHYKNKDGEIKISIKMFHPRILQISENTTEKETTK